MGRKKKFLIFLIIVLFFIGIFLIIYLWRGRPKLERKEIITDFSQSILPEEIRPIEGRHYYFKYKNETLYIAKFLFSSEERKDRFFEYYLTGDEKIYPGKIERTNITLDGFLGVKIKVKVLPFKTAYLLKNGNAVLIANGENEDNLHKVILWFLKKY
jgi:hypothetical protein